MPTKRSEWLPTDCDDIMAIQEVVNTDPIMKRKRVCENLSRVQRKALNMLREDTEIVVIASDKNMGLCVMDKTEYVRRVRQEMTRSSDTYEKWEIDTETLRQTRVKQLEAILRLLRKLPPTKNKKSLIKAVREDVMKVHDGKMKVAKIKGMPKLHKAGERMRLITTMCGHPLATVHKFIAKAMEPIMLRNCTVTTQSLEIMDEIGRRSWSGKDIIVTPDLISMYTNIEIGEAIDACIQEIAHDRDYACLQPQEWKALLWLAMHDIECTFEDCMYRQVKGLPMGSPASPVLAVIMLHHAVKKNAAVLPQGTYFRAYIDDGFVIFPEGTQNVQGILQDILKSTVRLRWDEETVASAREITTLVDVPMSFLDLTIYAKKSGENSFDLRTRVYTKPMGKYQYVPWHSAHPPTQKLSIVWGELHRRIRLCSEVEAWNATVRDLTKKLTRRGYAKEYISKRAADLDFAQRDMLVERTLAKTEKRRKQATFPWKSERQVERWYAESSLDTRQHRGVGVKEQIIVPLVVRYDPSVLQAVRDIRTDLERHMREVCGQALRCVIAFKNAPSLIARLQKREAGSLPLNPEPGPRVVDLPDRNILEHRVMNKQCSK